MTLTVLHSILGYLLSFRSDIIIPCFRKFAINLWFSFLVCMLSKTKKPPLMRGRLFLLWQGQHDSNMQQAVLETAALPLELHPYIDTPAGSRTQSKTGLKAAAFASFATGAYGGLCRIRTCGPRINGPLLYQLS